MMDYILKEIFIIVDVKRGDIGNIFKMYVKIFFEILDFDLVMVVFYMGVDLVIFFLEFVDKWVIFLVLIFNKGSQDF